MRLPRRRRVRDIEVWERTFLRKEQQFCAYWVRTEQARPSSACEGRRQNGSPRRGEVQPSLGFGNRESEPAKLATEAPAGSLSPAFAGSGRFSCFPRLSW